MQSTLNLTPTDPHADPHDHVLVARVAEEFSELAHDAIGRPSADVQTHIGADFAAGPSVLPVDTTFRAAAVNDGQIRGGRPSAGKRAIRSFIGFLLAVCIGAAAFAWQSYGDAARQTIAKWAPQLGLTSSPPLENSGLSEPTSPPAVQASAAKAAAAQTIDPAQPAVTNTAAPPSGAQSLQSLAADLANAGQQIAQLKASIEQLKTSQEQNVPRHCQGFRGENLRGQSFRGQGFRRESFRDQACRTEPAAQGIAASAAAGCGAGAPADAGILSAPAGRLSAPAGRGSSAVAASRCTSRAAAT
jgi:hypothetical protein